MSYSLFTDGGARGNPGPAGAGAVLMENSRIIDEKKEFIGITTNNEAEYYALIMGLELACQKNIRELDCFLDSELVVKQLNGEYKLRSHNLKTYFNRVKKLQDKFDSLTYSHVRREKNARADELVNMAVDEHVSKK